MRSHIGRHAHGNAGTSIYEQVGKGRRKHGRLHEALIVVRHPIYCALFHVAHESASQISKAGLSVAHGSWRIAFHTAEIALSIDKRVSHGPRLGHVDQSRVNGSLTVGMIVTAGITADFCALEMFLGWVQR